jgi:uncharacterized membrane protein YidH (DUF202 family)
MNDAPADGRTELAWERSALAFTGVGLALLKPSVPFGPSRPVLGWSILVLAATLFVTGRVSRRASDRAASSLCRVRVVSATAVLVSIAALVIAVAPQG